MILQDSVFPKFNKVRVLCIGDIMLDEFVYGTSYRLSPEAPVPILNISHNKKMLGGVGNVAVNLSKLGCEVILLSSVGNDINGNEILKLLEKHENIVSYIFTDKNKFTTTKTRFVHINQHLLRADRETTEDISKSTEVHFINLVKSFSDEVDIIVISDYNKGMLTSNLKQEIIKQYKSSIKIVDTKNTNLDEYSGADIIVPNVKELETFCNKKIESSDDIFKETKKLITKHNISNFLVTNGSDGMLLVESTKDKNNKNRFKRYECPYANKEPIDVSGAGDTVAATLALSLGSGYNYKQSTWISNIAGGLAVSKSGTSSIKLEELIEKIQEEQAFSE